ATESLRERPQRCTRPRDVEAHLATEELTLDQPSEDEVGVGHGGERPAPIAGRARIGAGALGPHPQSAARVDAGQSAAPGAHGMDFGGWGTPGETFGGGPAAVRRRPLLLDY